VVVSRPTLEIGDVDAEGVFRGAAASAEARYCCHVQKFCSKSGGQYLVWVTSVHNPVI
jgi:hypothetical protein